MSDAANIQAVTIDRYCGTKRAGGRRENQQVDGFTRRTACSGARRAAHQ
jgi:hypothetical protein